MEFFSFFPKPTRRKQAVSIAAITAAAVVAAIALILWLLPKPEAPHRLQGSWQCDGFFLTADAQNLCLNGLCFAYELLEPLEENPRADCPQLFVLDAGSMGVLRGEYYFEDHQLHLSVDGKEKIFSPVIAPPAAQVILPQAPRTVPSAKSGASVQRNHG